MEMGVSKTNVFTVSDNVFCSFKLVFQQKHQIQNILYHVY